MSKQSRSEKELINAINHYKQSLLKYSNDDNVNESKLLYYIHKLHHYPVRIRHLEQTGIGLTVNGLRKLSGEVADAAKNLIAKWKRMVVEESHSQEEDEDDDDEEEEEEEVNRPQNGNVKVEKEENETKVEHKESKHKSHSHHKEDKHKEKSSSSHKHTSDRKHSSSSKDEYKNKKIKQEPDTVKTESKSSKRKTDSDDEEEYDNERKVKKEREESKSSKRKKDSDDEEFEERKVKKERVESVPQEEKSSSKSKQHKKSNRISDEESSEDGKKEKYEKSKHKSKESSKHKSEKRHGEGGSSSSKDKHKDKHKSEEKKRESSSKHEKGKKKSESYKEKHGSSGKKEKLMHSDDGINSESGASFAEALGMLEPSTSKIVKKKVSSPLRVEKNRSSPSPSKKTEIMPSALLKPPQAEPVDINISSLLPAITPNYRPLGSVSDNIHQRHKAMCDDEALSRVMSSKNQRTKVYSGNKSLWGYVPTLFELCTRVLQDNIDALEYTGGVPYSILKPVLEKATANQLFQMEHHNPYLIEDTDELWQLHCAKEFKNKQREELETWREMYMRCLDEREAKLAALTANIKQSQDKSVPVRQTKLAYVDSFVKPPREIARKQAKNGTKNAITPSVKPASLATAGPAGQVSVPNPGSRAVERSGGSSNIVQKPKKAPLMQKALAAIKNRFRR